MGNIQTRDMADLLDAAMPSTPTTPDHRTLDMQFDPRSPSVEISRTPITVDRTPARLFDPRSPSAEIVRTPLYTTCSSKAGVTPSKPPPAQLSLSEDAEVEDKEELDPVFDPRSPTAGILRTPIQVAKVEAEVLADPRSPSVEIDRTPICSKAVASQEGSTDITEAVCSADSSPAVTSSGAESKQDDAPTTPTTKDDFSEIRRRKPKVLFKGNSDTPVVDIVDRSARSPLRSINNTLNNRSSPQAGDARSPLTTKDDQKMAQIRKKVDMNSPRAIVQRKQATKLSSKLGSCTLDAKTRGQSRSPARSPAAKQQFQIFEDDKENS